LETVAKKQQGHKKKSAETAATEPQTDRAAVAGEQEVDGSAAGVEATSEQQLQLELEASREEARNNHERYLRAMADMDNLRKRSQREKEDLAKFGNETLLREMLPVIDNLERAVAHAVEDKTTDGLLEGVRLTLDQFSKVLEKFQVVPIEALGQVFDPAHHQAMGQLETEDYPANTVVQELQKGYLLNERLLRPAMVMIAKAPVARAEAADTQDTEDTE
jgi:molecular chaperone GrpE